MRLSGVNMACCIITAYIMSKLIRACETLDLRLIDIKYNDSNDDTDLDAQKFQQTPIAVCKLRIDGMTCSACVSAIESSISSIAGVYEVSISLSFSRATVYYQSRYVSESELVAAVKAKGYDAHISTNSTNSNLEALEQSSQLASLRAPFRNAIVSAVLISIFNASQGIFSVLRFHYLLQAAIVTLPALWVQTSIAMPIYRSAWSCALNFNMDTLVSTSLILGIILAGLHLHLENFNASSTYLSTGTYLTAVILGGRYMQAILKRHTVQSLAGLYRMSQQASQALVWKRHSNTDEKKGKDAFSRVPAILLRAGDCIRIPPASTIPCDCYVISGESTVDQSKMTGESLVTVRSTGSFLMSGTTNLSSNLFAIVSKPQEESALEQLLSVVSEAAERSDVGPTNDFTVKFFVNAVLLLTMSATVADIIYFPATQTPLTSCIAAAERAMAILASACPCALGLATPSVLLSAMTMAWEKGFIVTGGLKTFRNLAGLTHMVMDKTGTITTGEVSVGQVFGLLEQWHFLAICAAERQDAMAHPVGKAVFQWALQKLSDKEKLEQSRLQVSNLHSNLGRGVQCRVRLKDQSHFLEVHIGTARFIQQSGITLQAGLLANESQSVSYIAIGKAHIATVILEDTIRPEAVTVIQSLKRNFNIDVTMLTGDTQREADRVSKSVLIPVLSSQALPLEKQKVIKELQSKDDANKVSMIGDGFNDIAAISCADAGILMSPGSSRSSAVSLTMADVVMTTSNLSSLLDLLVIARRSMSQIKFNYWWAGSYNAITVLLAIGLFEPLGIRIDAAMAGLLMACSSISVMAFSLLLRRPISVT